MTAGGESDIGSVDGMMPEDVEAAYQVFIQLSLNDKTHRLILRSS